jgi:hypothetical protein
LADVDCLAAAAFATDAKTVASTGLPAAQVLRAGTEPVFSGGIVAEAASGSSASAVVDAVNQVIQRALLVSQHKHAMANTRLAQLVSSLGTLGGDGGAGGPKEASSDFHAGGAQSSSGQQMGHLVVRASEGEVTYSRDVVRGVRRYKHKSKAKPRA